MDGFGALLRACWTKGPKPGLECQVIERNDGYVSIEDAWRYFTHPEELVVCERHAVELAAAESSTWDALLDAT